MGESHRTGSEEAYKHYLKSAPLHTRMNECARACAWVSEEHQADSLDTAATGWETTGEQGAHRVSKHPVYSEHPRDPSATQSQGTSTLES